MKNAQTLQAVLPQPQDILVQRNWAANASPKSYDAFRPKPPKVKIARKWIFGHFGARNFKNHQTKQSGTPGIERWGPWGHPKPKIRRFSQLSEGCVGPRKHPISALKWPILALKWPKMASKRVDVHFFGPKTPTWVARKPSGTHAQIIPGFCPKSAQNFFCPF